MGTVTIQTSQGAKTVNFNGAPPSEQDISDIIKQQGWSPAVKHTPSLFSQNKDPNEQGITQGIFGGKDLTGKQTPDNLGKTVAGGISNYAKSVFGSLNDASDSSIQSFKDAEAGKQGGFSAGFQMGGQLAKSVLSPITDAIAPVVQGDAQALFGKVANSGAGAAVEKTENAISGIADKFSKTHPVLSKNIGAFGNIVALGTAIPAGADVAATTGDLAKTGLDTAKSSISDANENALIQSAEDANTKANSNTWEKIKPKKADPASLQPKGLFGKVTQVPTSADNEMIAAAKPYVAGAKDGFEARANMKAGIAEQGENLKQGLKDTKAIYSDSQVQGALNKIEPDPQIVGDSEKIYNKIKSKMMSYVGKGGRLSDLLDARKNFDTYIDKYFPNLYSSDRLTPIKTGVLDMRRAVNDFINSRLPDGKLPDGTSFKQSLKNQSQLYDAIDNIEDKLPKEGTPTTKLGKATEYLKKNKGKIATGAATVLGAGEVAKHLP